jgi:hypothetical protein
MRFFWRIKPAYANSLPPRHYLNTPFTLVQRHAKQLSFISFGSLTHILKVSKSRYFAQISKTIIKFVSVYVVNMQFRPTSSCVEPSQPVRKSFSVKHTNGEIAVRTDTSCNATNKILPSFSFFPYKHASSRAIQQYLSNIRKRNIGIILHSCFQFWLPAFYHSEFPE